VAESLWAETEARPTRGVAVSRRPRDRGYIPGLSSVTNSRGHCFKLFKRLDNRNNIRSFSFSCRRIDCWNSLPVFVRTNLSICLEQDVSLQKIDFLNIYYYRVNITLHFISTFLFLSVHSNSIYMRPRSVMSVYRRDIQHCFTYFAFIIN